MEGSRAEQRYELNGKECRQRRKDVSGSRGGGGGGGGGSGVIHRPDRACSVQPRTIWARQGGSEGVTENKNSNSHEEIKREKVQCDGFTSSPRICGGIFLSLSVSWRNSLTFGLVSLFSFCHEYQNQNSLDWQQLSIENEGMGPKNSWRGICPKQKRKKMWLQVPASFFTLYLARLKHGNVVSSSRGLTWRDNSIVML